MKVIMVPSIFFQKLSIDPGFYNIQTYEDLDGERIRASKRLSTQTVKKHRKVLKAHRKKNN